MSEHHPEGLKTGPTATPSSICSHDLVRFEFCGLVFPQDIPHVLAASISPSPSIPGGYYQWFGGFAKES